MKTPHRTAKGDAPILAAQEMKPVPFPTTKFETPLHGQPPAHLKIA
jgi:hypothetical protein